MFSSKKPYVPSVLKPAVWEQVRVPAGCDAPQCAPAVPGRRETRGRSRATGGRGPGVVALLIKSRYVNKRSLSFSLMFTYGVFYF